jgi:hypothetical protein
MKALHRQLRAASDDFTRDRVLGAMSYIRALYGLEKPTAQDQGDLRRRRFVRERHHVWPKST